MAMLPVSEYEDDDNAEWDEDQVDLSFLSVSDLQSLLTVGNIRLDFHLFRQSSQIHKQMRKELNSVSSTNQPYSQEMLYTFPQPLDYLTSSSQAFKSSTSSGVTSEALLEKSSIFSSSISSQVSFNSTNDTEANALDLIRTISDGSSDVLTNINFHGQNIICISLGFLLLFFLFILFLVIFRSKTAWKKRHQDKEFPLHQSYIKTSYSLDEMPSRPKQSCVVEMKDKNRTSSPFYNKMHVSPCSHVASFSTFHPPGQDRSSPEGSSGGDTEVEPLERVFHNKGGRRSIKKDLAGEDKTSSWSSNDKDEGIECEEDINISFKAEDPGQCGGEGQLQQVQELDNFVQGQGSGQGGNLCQDKL